MIKTELVIDSDNMGIDEAINKAIERIENEGRYSIHDIKFSGNRALIICMESCITPPHSNMF